MMDRDALSAITKKGVGLPLAGALFWIASTAILQTLPMSRAGVWMMFATGLVFPIGLFISKRLKADLLAKHPPLSHLAGILAAVQLFYWPVAILSHMLFPLWFPFVLATLFGSHFLPYGWLYRSAGYYFIGIAVPLASVIVASFGAEISYACTAPVAAGLYLIGCVQVLREVSRLSQARRLTA